MRYTPYYERNAQFGAAAASGGTPIASGQTLQKGAQIRSPNGQVVLAFQTDGNVVMYHGSRPLWASNTRGSNADTLAMQADGNFVLYGAGRPLWSTGTQGHSGARVVVQNDGNLVVYDTSNHPLWASQRHSMTATYGILGAAGSGFLPFVGL